MPTPKELEAKRREELAEMERQAAISNYYESAKLFANCAVGDVVKRDEYRRILKTAERKMKKLFDDAEARMTRISIAALRGERV